MTINAGTATTKSREIEFIHVGAQVTIDGNVSARVTAVVIREHELAYECVWWAEGSRNCMVIEAWEIQPEGDIEKQRACSIL